MYKLLSPSRPSTSQGNPLMLYSEPASKPDTVKLVSVVLYFMLELEPSLYMEMVYCTALGTALQDKMMLSLLGEEEARDSKGGNTEEGHRYHCLVFGWIEMDTMRNVLDCKLCRQWLVIGQSCCFAVGNSLRTNKMLSNMFVTIVS